MSETFRYNAEWAQLGESVVVSWGEPELASCATLDDVLAAIRIAPDAVLGALLRRAQEGDQLAGRVVVQAMLGKLVLFARADRAATLDDYVAHLWCVLMRYPVARRRGSVAGGLALDTRKAVRAEREPTPPCRGGIAEPDARASRTTVGAAGFAVTDPDADAHVADGAHLLRRAVTLAVIDVETARLLHAVYIDGLPSRAAGEPLALAPATVRRRCFTAVRRMAAHREELVA